ncbi:capsid protein [Heyndrickxia coagulans]|uniref:capsid protein n=1 Tax=Heyndrickxia coagulans TaxID=1398 RepID=UPI0008F8ED2B|nr:capsid protein [Heyndrickxia coagulans]APB37975.1 capsid protein [Heyndrickxia coagulans]WNE61794.1 capsid protein [Heyndrickxia coagulans]
MAAVNYAELYLQALQQRFADALMFYDLYNTPNNDNIKWVNAKTVQIPHIVVGGYQDVARDAVGGYTRRADNAWESKTLQHDREFRTLVDPTDIDETNLALSIANITRVFNDEEKIPELDKYMASKLYTEFTKYGGTALTDNITESNVLGMYDELMYEMDEAEVPQNGRILYVTPTVSKVLKNADKVTRFLQVTDAGGAINRNVRSLDEVKIVTVPSSRMKTIYNFTDGAVADTSAAQINMILVHPLSIITPMKYEFVSLSEPSAVTGGKYLYYERAYWDVFVLEQKAPGIKFAITQPTKQQSGS